MTLSRLFLLLCAAILSPVACSELFAEDPAKPAAKESKSDSEKKPEAEKEKPATDEPAKKLDKAALEKDFTEKMANSVLVGRFTVDGAPADKPATEERYELESVTKLRGDYWTFLARIKYGKNDVKLPITVKMLWAGDTPMVSLTDFTIPGMGTFTSRVFFYEDRYAGTWQHGPVGGHMFGRIEKSKAADEKSEEKKPEDKKPEEKKPAPQK